MTEEHTSRLKAISRAVAELSDEENARGNRLVRTCDAFGLARWALEEAAAHGEIPNEDDLENARGAADKGGRSGNRADPVQARPRYP